MTMFVTGQRDENGIRWSDMAAEQPKDPQSFFWHKGINLFKNAFVWFNSAFGRFPQSVVSGGDEEASRGRRGCGSDWEAWC